MQLPFLSYLSTVIWRAMMSIVNNQGTDGMVSGLSPTCKKYVNQLIERALIHKLTPQDKLGIHMSGRFINEMGQFSSCSASPHMAYYLVQAGAEFVRINLGVCFSDQCTEDDWAILRNFLYEKVKEKISRPTSYFYKFNDFLVVNVSRVERYTKKVLPDPLTKIFLITLIAFSLLVVISSLYRWIYGKKRTPLKERSLFQSEESKSPAGSFMDSTLLSKNESILDVFTIQHNTAVVRTFSPTSPTNTTIDILRIMSYVGIMIMNFAFVHALISKVAVDASTRDHYIEGFQLTVLQSSLFVPDLLLFISGFTSLQSVLRVFRRTGIKTKPWRLTFVYFGLLAKKFARYSFGLFLAMTYIWKILPLLSSGPLSATDLGCTKRNFLKSIFLVNSSFAGDESRMCGPWYWYPAAEFQLFLLVPFLCMISLYRPLASLFCTLFICMGGLFLTAGYNQLNGIKASSIHDGTWITSMMTFSYLRSFCYFLGCSCALYQDYVKQCEEIHKSEDDQRLKEYDDNNCGGPTANREEIRRPKHQFFHQKNWFCNLIIVTGICIFAIDAALFSLYFKDYKDNSWYPQWKHTMFNTFGPSMFAVSLVMVVGGMVQKHYSSVSSILADSITFRWMRAVYFEVFLISVPFILTLFFSFESILTFSSEFAYYCILSEASLTLMISIVFYLLISRPFKSVLNKLIPL